MEIAQRYSISQLARAAGVPTSTLRYYERRRLLRPDARSAANYRVYGPAALERLSFIRAAQANGFTLEDIAILLDLRDGKNAPRKEVQQLINNRLAELETRLEELQRVKTVLRTLLTSCQRGRESEQCPVIENIRKRSSNGPAKSVCCPAGKT